MTDPRVLASREFRQRLRANLAARYQTEVAEAAARNGELPKLTQAEIDATKTQIEQAKALATAAGDNERIKQLDAAKLDIEYQERRTKGLLTVEDQVREAAEKEHQAAELADIRAWLARPARQTKGQRHLERRLKERAEQYAAEIAEVEARSGELPRRPQAEIDAIKAQLDAARTERLAARATLEQARDAAVVLRDKLQIDLAAATTAPQRQAIRAQLDEAKAAVDKAVADLLRINGTIDGLRLQRDEILLDERLTKNTTTADDAPRIQQRKDQQAAKVADAKRWLAKHGK